MGWLEFVVILSHLFGEHLHLAVKEVHFLGGLLAIPFRYVVVTSTPLCEQTHPEDFTSGPCQAFLVRQYDGFLSRTIRSVCIQIAKETFSPRKVWSLEPGSAVL